MNKRDDIQLGLREFGLSKEEANIYIELLKNPSTHLALSQATSINRTKVYRIVQDLERYGLVARQTDDRGSFLIACDPNVLESFVITQEQKAMEQRGTLQQILPILQSLQSQNDSSFVTRTYEGLEGFRQMCWHELKAKGELFTLGSGLIEDLIPNHFWAEKHRQLSVEAGYKVYEIINDTPQDIVTFTSNEDYMKRFHYRVLPADVLKFENQIIIYNDTVSIYHWRDNTRCGVEIINKSYAQMMRQIFWQYWGVASDP